MPFDRSDYPRNRGKRAHPKMRFAANERLGCEAKTGAGALGCPKLRWWTTLYCRFHHGKNKYHGDPFARAVPKSDTEPYLAEVRRLFAIPANTEQVSAAESKMRMVLHPGLEPSTKKVRGPKGARRLLWIELTRLEQAGVTPREALEAMCATWLLGLEQDRFKTQKVHQHAIANAVFGTANFRSYKVGKTIQVRRPGSGAIGLLAGELLGFSLFVSQLHTALQTERNERNRLRSSMSKPLAYDATAPTPYVAPPPPPQPTQSAPTTPRMKYTKKPLPGGRYYMQAEEVA